MKIKLIAPARKPEWICGFVLFSTVILLFITKYNFAITSDELLSYQKNLNETIEEVCFNLEPGALKKSVLSQKEKDSKIYALMETIMGSTKNMLTYYTKIYKEIAERLSKEITVSDPVLASWHQNLVEGFKDSFSVTSDALAIFLEDEKIDVYAEKKISNGIMKNAEYHSNLKAELEKIVQPIFPDKSEQQKYIQEMPIYMYIELTWK